MCLIWAVFLIMLQLLHRLILELELWLLNRFPQLLLLVLLLILKLSRLTHQKPTEQIAYTFSGSPRLVFLILWAFWEAVRIVFNLIPTLITRKRVLRLLLTCRCLLKIIHMILKLLMYSCSFVLRRLTFLARGLRNFI